MSLKVIAAETLARIRSGETERETADETVMKQMQRTDLAFHKVSPRLTVTKQHQPQKTAIPEACFTVSLSRNGNVETAPALSEWVRRIAAFHHENLPVEEISAAYPNTRLAPQRWRRMLTDADAFLRDWGVQAARLGWRDLDLFGCSPGFARRLDRDGLLNNLDRAVIIAMTDTTATIDAGRGARQTYRRVVKPGAVAWWQALADMEAGRG